MLESVDKLEPVYRKGKQSNELPGLLILSYSKLCAVEFVTDGTCTFQKTMVEDIYSFYQFGRELVST